MVGAYLLAKIVLEDEICRGMRQFLALKRGAVSRLILIFAGINLTRQCRDLFDFNQRKNEVESNCYFGALLGGLCREQPGAALLPRGAAVDVFRSHGVAAAVVRGLVGVGRCGQYGPRRAGLGYERHAVGPGGLYRPLAGDGAYSRGGRTVFVGGNVWARPYCAARRHARRGCGCAAGSPTWSGLRTTG